MTALRVLVTGGNGVLGCALRDIRPRWMYLGHSECDVRFATDVRRTLRALAPDVVLHTAALTDHQHPNAQDVIETNILGTQYVAEACAAFDIPLVYTSTHYVYEGVLGGYAETDVPQPIGVYAASKLAGENAVRALLPRTSLVVRGSWYTRETRLDRWAARGALVDAYCSREPVTEAARKIVALTEAGVRGVINIGGARRSFAQILDDDGYDNFKYLRRDDFNRRGSDHAMPYPFPADTSVNTEKFRRLWLTLP